jgi:hypothetical protein
MYAVDLDAVVPQSEDVQPKQIRPPEPQSWGSQLWTLIRRYLTVIASDRGSIGLMVFLPAILGGVSVVIPAKYGLTAPTPPNHFNGGAGMIMMILVVSMCFSGAANSVRELIKERVIYERERATGLSRFAYLMSKVIVLGLITDPAVELCLAIIAIGFTSMMFGLVISSLVKTAEKTMPLLVMFPVVQLVFTGTLFQIFGKPGLEQIA